MFLEDRKLSNIPDCLMREIVDNRIRINNTPPPIESSVYIRGFMGGNLKIPSSRNLERFREFMDELFSIPAAKSVFEKYGAELTDR